MKRPQRRHNRLENYDYSQPGSYFITVCMKEKCQCLWNPSVGADSIRPHERQHLSAYGILVDTAIRSVATHYSGVAIDHYVVMPNHIHMIITLSETGGRMLSAPTNGIETILGQMKRWVSKESKVSLWQKTYHDHIIRDEREYQKIWSYIDTNPQRWEKDCFYTEEIQQKFTP